MALECKGTQVEEELQDDDNGAARRRAKVVAMMMREEKAGSAMEEEVEVCIVGGGLAGLALLLALQTRGISAQLYEKYENLRSDTATAIGIGPNGVAALEGIYEGLSKQIAQLGTYTRTLKVEISSMENDISSKIVNWPDMTYITVSWKLVQQSLAELVSQENIHGSHELLLYEPTQDKGVATYFQVQDESGNYNLSIVHTKLLIGADGIWSTTRNQMFNDSPRYLHMVDWNAVIYDLEQRLLEGVGKGEILLHRDISLSMSFILANAGNYALWILRKVDESGEMGTSLWRKQGSFGNPMSKVRALQQIEGLGGSWNALRNAIQCSDELSVFERKIMDMLPLHTWSDADGRVLLIGDAAHAMYVGPGQGARTAFEDAHQLAMLLEKAKNDGFTKDSIRQVVKTFEEVRIPRLQKMQEYAAQSTELPRFQPEWVQRLTPQEKQKRGFEFMRWVESYPHYQQGDPTSTYFRES